MLKLYVSKRALARLAILQRYKVHPHAYGICPSCNTEHDFWKYACTREEIEKFMCPGNCGPLRELTPLELADALASCEREGCFEEEFLFSTPLCPQPIR